MNQNGEDANGENGLILQNNIPPNPAVGGNGVNNQIIPGIAEQNQVLPGAAVAALNDNTRVVQSNMDDWRHLLCALVRKNLQLPEFSGQNHEDTENFLRVCDSLHAC